MCFARYCSSIEHRVYIRRTRLMNYNFEQIDRRLIADAFEFANKKSFARKFPGSYFHPSFPRWGITISVQARSSSSKGTNAEGVLCIFGNARFRSIRRLEEEEKYLLLRSETFIAEKFPETSCEGFPRSASRPRNRNNPREPEARDSRVESSFESRCLSSRVFVYLRRDRGGKRRRLEKKRLAKLVA